MESYKYIGYPQPFTPGDKVKIIEGYTFLIDGLINKGLVNYEDIYTFIRYDGYMFGNNCCVLKETKYHIIENALIKI